MPNYNSTARVPFKHGGSVKKPKVKRIILGKWGPKKPWPGATKAAEEFRKKYGKAKGGKVKKDYKLGTKFQGDYKGKTVPGKIKEFVKTGAKQTAGTAKKIAEWNSPENRKKRQKEYIKKHGKPQPRRKTLAVTDKYKKIREQRKFSEAGFKPLRAGKAKGGKADKNWIQGVNKSIKARGTKGVCTGKKFGGASCKPGSRRYNLAKTFKKMARSRHASGGLVRFI